MHKRHNIFRWVIFASVLVTYLFMSSQRTAPGLITDQLMADFGVTASTIGLVMSVQFLVYTSLQIPMGMLSDRYGPNFFLVMGALLTGVGTVVYSLSSHIVILFAAKILTGIGDATIWVNAVLILSQWFNKKEFTRLIGVAGMTGSLGFLMATLPLSAVIVTLGWRASFFSMGLLLILFSILLYAVLVKKPKQPFFKRKEMQSEKMGVVLRRLLSNSQAWALFCCHFGIVGGYIGFIGSWAVPYVMDVYGLTRIGASQVMMLSLAGALVGAPFIGWMASRLGTIKRPYVVFQMIVLLCWTIFLLFSEHPPFYVLIILFVILGFGFGSNSLTFAIVRQTFRISESGIASGFMNTGGFLSAALLPGTFGYILARFQSVSGSTLDGYQFSFITPVVFSVIGLVGVLFIKEWR